MTTTEAAQIIGCTRQMVGNYIRWVRLKAVIVIRNGVRQYDIDPESVDRFLKLPPERLGRPKGSKSRSKDV